jgi:hypothetical protein
MSQLVISDAVRAELERATEPVDLVDQSGHTVGHYIPQTSPVTEPLCPWEPTLTEEEIDRRVSQGGRSLSEIWKRLGVK